MSDPENFSASQDEFSSHEHDDDVTDSMDDDADNGEVPVEEVLQLDDVQRICCIGAGRVGVLSMAVLSRHWLNKTFVVVDRDIDLINNINGVNEENEILMLFSEPGMDDLLDEAMNVNHNLVFSSNIAGLLLSLTFVG